MPGSFGFLSTQQQRYRECVSDNTRVVTPVQRQIPRQIKRKGSTEQPKMKYLSQNALAKAQRRIAGAVGVATAEYKKGVHETSKNDSARIKDYKYGMRNDWNWCSYFANYCYGLGQNDKRTLFGIAPDKVGRSQDVKKAAQKGGYFSDANKGYTPTVGDLAIWTSKTNAAEGHIGIVTKVYPNGSYDVTEGNKDDKVSVIHYNSQRAKDADTERNKFAGFVRMTDYLYDLENNKITASLSPEETTTDLYENDDKSLMGYMA